MSLITGTPITFNGKEARTAILAPAFEKPLIAAIMSVQEGIVAKEQIAFFGRLQKVTKIDPGCGSSPSDNALPITEKYWDPVKLEMWVKQCATDLEQTFLVWGLAKGYDKYDLTKATTGDDPQGFWDEFVMSLMQDAAYEDFLRIAFLGDTTLAAGALTGGATDLPNYNQVDGFWKQIVSIAGVRKYTITANAAASKAAQDDLAADEMLKAMRALANTADPRLRAANDKIFLTTESLYNNWVDYRESQNLETSFALQETGLTAPRYRNIPVIPLEFLDRHIRADFDNGTIYDTPHRLILTTRENLKAGFDSVEAMQAFDAWYEKKDKDTHMRGNYKLDFKVMFDYLVAAAY